MYEVEHEHTPEPTKHHKPRKESLKAILSTVGVFILAPIIALILVAFVFQSYRVDGDSMESTLSNNDRLIVSKIEKTWSRITSSDYIPDRYEIVVFKETDSFGLKQYGQIQLIKRVIGLPGERVVIKNNKVTVYNEANPNGFNPDANQDYTDNNSLNTSGNVDIVVGPDEVFAMGDNRNNSLDSRAFGPIKSSNIVGKLAFKIFPL